jgi:3-oxoacyl-(acyl-carrier-protein) synthase
VVSPNAVGLTEFELALAKGRSGVKKIPEMAELGFGCCVAGVPEGVDELSEALFDEELLRGMNTGHRYAGLAALEAWGDAGFERPPEDAPTDWNTGAIIGTGTGGMDTFAPTVAKIDAGKVRRLGGRVVEQVMASGVSARVAGLLGLGNQVTTNASACSTGAEALVMGLRHIRQGLADRMLCGGAEGISLYTWAGFDAMRVLCRRFNDAPQRASRPLSASAAGFVPSGGAGVLCLESLENAYSRGARIYAEVLGGAVNSGGQRAGGSMTAPNPEGVRRCIRAALRDARIQPSEIDAISGHLTGTRADTYEVRAWADVLGCGPKDFPPITATKSLIGHALSAAGSIESVGSVLMVHRGFIHPSLNCEDLHPDLEPFAASIPQEEWELSGLKTIAKASFGFGDVNACLVFRRWEDRPLGLEGEAS